MKLIDDLLASVAGLDHPVRRVCVGLHWTIVQSRHTGIAHTYKTSNKVELESSGDLVGRSAVELALRLRSWEPLEASLGLAALNSLIEPVGTPGNVFAHVLSVVPGKTITVVGRFPFNDQIAQAAGQAYFLEMEPQAGELPPSACEEVVPQSDIVLISATALINQTLPRLLELGRSALTVVLGPSTPMNDVLFRHGARVLGGVRVTDPEALIGSVQQGVKKHRKLAGLESITRSSPGA